MNRDMQKQLEKLLATVAKQNGDVKSPTIAEYSKIHLERKNAKTGLRLSTKRATNYQFDRNILPFWGHLRLDEFTSSHWDKTVSEQQASPNPHLTRFFNLRKCLVELFHRAHEDGLIDKIPKIDNPDEPKNVGRVVTEEEFELIQSNVTYPIFKLFFFTLRRMGCRPREILQWEWDFIEWPENDGDMAWISIPARISKTARNRRIPINSEVWAKLLEWRAQGPMPSKYVFPNRTHPGQPQLSYHGAWATACKKAGVAHCVPYDYRRTFITHKMENPTTSGVFVAKFLDTSVLQIEKTYAKAQKKTMEGIAG